MKSSRPYLLRAIHEWIIDSDCTPFLLVNADAPGVQVPRQHVENDKIILNTGQTATEGLVIGDDEVTFNARFSGKAQTVVAPIGAVLAIYARENGQGMLFNDESGETEVTAETELSSSPGDGTVDQGNDDEPEGTSPGKPNLRVIK